jgi:DNA polymerase-1
VNNQTDFLAKKTSKVLIVDTSYLIFRSYFAYPQLTYNEQPVGALFGFCKTVLALIKDFQITELIFAIDLPKPTFRHLIYQEYKAGRPEAAPEMKQQFPLIYEWCKQISDNFFALEGYEADDMVFSKVLDSVIDQAKLSKDLHLQDLIENTFTHTPNEVFIFSADKDLYQTLIFPEVKFIKTEKFRYYLYDQKNFQTEFGLEPIQWLDYKALVGDNSDNLKGISGVGPKTAIKLLQKVGSLHSLLDALGVSNGFAFRSYFETTKEQEQDLQNFIEAKENQTLIEKIKANLEILQQTYELASLHYVPNLGLQSGFDLEKGLPTFTKFNFTSLIKSVQSSKNLDLKNQDLNRQESLF